MTTSGEPAGETPLQLSLEFRQPVPGFAGLVVTPANAPVIATLRQPQAWPVAVMALVGPARSGLTMLADAFAHEGGGERLEREQLDGLDPAQLDQLAAGRLALDRADRPGDEARLLSVITSVNARGGRLLLTAHRPPATWPVAQRDLSSRLRSMPVLQIGEPDDETMHLRLREALDRYYYCVPEDVAKYLVMRLPHTYAALETCVKRLVGMVSGAGRDLTVPLAREALRLEGFEDDDEDIATD